MTIVLERATEPELIEIYDYAGQNRQEATGITADNHQEEMIKAYENSIKHGAYFLVARNNGILVGWVLMDKSTDWFTGKEIGWISDVYVKAEFRKQGYAKQLLQQSLLEFKSLGYSDVRLNVFSFNESAIRLYEKIGFQDLCKFMKVEI
ncbi:GNAT family N-acetyltransferase [Bacillus sp. FJAT-49736]|uniref:GNAT family N-acetyltransferase n=1 Tax=Bacillus sp. FJAT-49736 TaxID=2833582 RepID=UPI001BC93231|nr:GNAT family N-acetyltransferase [Bacillus sp. FJAT-49736]MBS4174661.1 GNAT family N-acetyltransferase [Bacillus sp. FJAT-49736]